jgi:hypothetical protein
VIAECKSQVDRLCTLSLTKVEEMEHLFEDHQDIYRFLAAQDFAQLDASIRRHLGRLDALVAAVHGLLPDYFEVWRRSAGHRNGTGSWPIIRVAAWLPVQPAPPSQPTLSPV